MAAIGLVSAFGCGDRGSSEETLDLTRYEIPVTEVRAKLVSHSPAIGRPGRAAVDGHWLWIQDSAGDPGLHLIDANTGGLIQSVGRLGEGPGEFSGGTLFGLSIAGAEGAAWAWDGGMQRVTLFQPRPRAEYYPVIIDLQAPQRIRRVIPIAGKGFIGQANALQARWFVFDADGTLQQSIPPAALLGPEDAPVGERLNGKNSSTAICPWPGRGFVAAYGAFGRVECYDENARFVRVADVPFPSEMRMRVDNQGVARHENRRASYKSCATTSEHVFAVFSGHWKGPGEVHYWGSFVHVFDWEGELRAVVHLNKPIFGIAIEPRSATLYGTSPMTAEVFSFDVGSVALR